MDRREGRLDFVSELMLQSCETKSLYTFFGQKPVQWNQQVITPPLKGQIQIPFSSADLLVSFLAQLFECATQVSTLNF